MSWLYRKKGFTLLELMIVVIVIGILATLAVPRFITATKKAKQAEAKSMLGTIRSSQWRYYQEHQSTFADTIGNLDIDMTASAYFTYSGADDSGNPTYLGKADGSAQGLGTFKINEVGTITEE